MPIVARTSRSTRQQRSGTIGLEDEGVDARIEQDRRLLGRRAGSLRGRGADVAHDEPIRSDGPSRQRDGPAIDVLDGVRSPIVRQPRPVGAEGVAEEGLGAGRHVACVEVEDVRGMRQVPERRIIGAEVQPSGDQPRAHGRVEDQRTAIQRREEASRNPSDLRIGPYTASWSTRDREWFGSRPRPLPTCSWSGCDSVR